MAFSEYLNIHYCIWYLVFILFNDFNPNNVQYFETFSDLGAVHKRRHQLGGGEGSKIGQNCRRIVLKNCRHGGGGCRKSGKKCRRLLWMVPYSVVSIKRTGWLNYFEVFPHPVLFFHVLKKIFAPPCSFFPVLKKKFALPCSLITSCSLNRYYRVTPYLPYNDYL